MLWHVAKHLTNPRDVLSLGRTSKSVWKLVNSEIYRAEVLQTRDEEIQVAGDPDPSAPSATTLQKQSILNHRPVYSQKLAIHFSISNGYDTATNSLIDAAKKLWVGYLDVLWGPGLTPLHLAAATKNTEVVKSLHEAGCFLNADAYLLTGRAQNFDNRRHLPALVPHNRFQLLHAPNWCEQVDALSLAIMHKQPKTAQYLLEKMELRRPFLYNAERISPLHVAALVGDVKLVETLLDLGCPQETSRTVTLTGRQETALQYAVAHRGDNTAVMELLLARGARIAARAVHGMAVLMSGMNALEIAVWNRHSLANAKFLLSYAVQNNRLEATNWREIIDWKLYWDHLTPEVLATVEPIDLVSEEQLKSSLLRMVSKNPEDDLPTVMFLVEKLFAPDSQHSGYLLPWNERNINEPDHCWTGCVLNAEVELKTSCYDLFKDRPNLPSLSQLWSHQLAHAPIRVEKVDALSLAIIHNQPDTICYLLDEMDLQRLHLPNRAPINPLHIAALVGDTQTVEFLLDLNCPLETSREVDDDITVRETALHWAAAGHQDNTQVLKVLLARGASLNATAMNGKTALEVALLNSQGPANAQFLLNYSIKHEQLHAVMTFRWAAKSDRMLPAIRTMVEDTNIVSHEQLKNVLLGLAKHCYPDQWGNSLLYLIEKVFSPCLQHSGYLLPWDECNADVPNHSLWVPETALQMIISSSHFDRTHFQHFLQSRDWYLEAPDVKGRTAFEYAIYHRKYDAAVMLLESRAECKFHTSHELLAMAEWLRKWRNTENKHRYWAARLEQTVKHMERKVREEATEPQR
ncbi:hypothetical protein PG993_009724 [Apiospora rasikravindrae]|uniref:Ankyrin n=1 Tax=Apiospora rasikravindrae TaxID=990691 RepID=A0ABR1SLY9_9PEZI